MGGKLDATNILNNQVMCVIAKIARDHEGFLGNTLQEIALHKAGILRKNVPYIINPRNETNVKNVIAEYGDQIGAIQTDLTQIPRKFYTSSSWQRMSALLRSAQQDNPLLAAVAAATALQSRDIPYLPAVMAENLLKISKTVNPGRLEVTKVPPVFGDPAGEHPSSVKGRRILVDGAHNADAARMLCDHVNSNQRRTKRGIKGKIATTAPRQGWRVTWVIAMTEGKDAEEYLSILLQPGDTVITTTFGPVDGMPWVKPMDPKQLLKVAQSVQYAITGMAMPRDGVLRALCAAKYMTDEQGPIVLTGSLYLVGDFHRELRPRRAKDYTTAPEFEEDRRMFKAMLQTEEKRVRAMFGANLSHSQVSHQHSTAEEELLASTISPEFEEVDMESKRQDQQKSEREKWRDMQAELAAIDVTLDAIANEELSMLQKSALQDDENKRLQQEVEKPDEEVQSPQKEEEKKVFKETDEHDIEKNGNEQAGKAGGDQGIERGGATKQTHDAERD